MDDPPFANRLLAGRPMARAWLTASKDLGVRFFCPFSFKRRGQEYVCTGLLPDFGGAQGALICSGSDPAPEDVFEAADEMGYYASGLNPRSYEKYDRDAFIRTLNDWGWFGDVGRIPPWFKGRMGLHGG